MLRKERGLQSMPLVLKFDGTKLAGKIVNELQNSIRYLQNSNLIGYYRKPSGASVVCFLKKLEK